AMLDRDRQALAGLAPGGERSVSALDDERDVPARERERRVRAQRARQQSGLAEDLESVADPEHEPTVGGEACDGGHHGRKAGDRSAAKVVAVGEASRKGDCGDVPRQLELAMPDERRLGAQRLECKGRVPVVVRAWEDDDRDLRPTLGHGATVISYDSISGLASSCSHIRSSSSRARSGSSASSSSSTSRPTLAVSTAKPRWRSELSTASPCGSRMPGLGLTSTVAFTRA